MKKNKLTFWILVSFFLLMAPTVGAQTKNTPTPTATASATISPVSKDVQEFKNKIADKIAAELKKEDQKAYAGTISKIDGGAVNFTTNDGQALDAKIDDTLTKIYNITGSTKKEIKMSDLEKGDYIVATGPLLNKSVSANFIYRDVEYLVQTGKVTEINSSEYWLKVLNNEKDSITLDFETYTKVQLINIKTLALERSGFSKVKEGDTIHYVFIKTGQEKESNRYSAQKILIVPQEYFTK
jgi:hypothetical protein